MRILSIITLCFIIAASAYGGQRNNRNEAKDKPAAAQSSAPQNSSAPASTVRNTPSATSPTTTAHGVQLPGPFYQSGTISHSPRSSSATNTPRETTSSSANSRQPGYGGHSGLQTDRNTGRDSQSSRPNAYRPDTSTRPNSDRQTLPAVQSIPDMAPVSHSRTNTDYHQGNTSNSASHGSASDSRTSPYSMYRKDRPVDVAQTPDRRHDAPSRNSSGPIGYAPLGSDKSGPSKDYGDQGSSNRQDDRSHTPSSIDRGHSVPHPSSVGNPHSGDRVHSVGYSPYGTTYTVGYHRPSKIYVPQSYTPPSYRQGHYYYSPTYRAKPCNYGYWAFDYTPGFSYRSAYFHFGLLPYVQITRINEGSYVSVSYESEPLYIHGEVYRDSSRYVGLDEALADVRSAWISGRYDLIEQHIQPGRSIAILLDGKYDYGISSDDYLAMTRDAISDLDTVSFVWDKVRERRDGMVTAYGQHSYRSGDQTHGVYVSYTFQRVGRDYYLTEVGSSLDPLN